MRISTVVAWALSVSVAAAALGQAAPAPLGTPAATAAAIAPSPSEIGVKSKVDAVTVYRGQALVTRSLTLPAGSGIGEMTISDLPERIVAGSLFAEGGDGVEVRSVRYRERPVPDDVREEVRALDDKIVALNDKIASNKKQMQVLQEQRTYLDKLETFSAPTASAELTKGVLNADQLKTLTAFQFDTRKGIAKDELALQVEARDLLKQGELLQRQHEEIAGRSSRTLREAIVFINRERAGGSLRVRYLVDGANWSPSYNIRADAEKKAATVEYLASIEQMSGEDWKDVQMTLSTAAPNLVAAAPALRQLNIALAPLGQGNQGGGQGGVFGQQQALDNTEEFRNADYGALQKGLSELRKNAETVRNSQSGGTFGSSIPASRAREEQTKNDYALNAVADQIQVLELVTQDSRARRPSASEGVVVTYDMRTRTSLPSRADRQLIQIDQLPMKSEFHKTAVPVLTSYVYEEAELTNTSKVVLLEGPVASYVGGQFVGSGTIGTVAVGQPFTVGFGIDSSLRATRERQDKVEETQGGNRIVTYTYRISLENFGTAAADVRVLDRLPVGNEKEVRVIFNDAETIQISKDKDYLLNDRKKGILRWDVTVAPQKTASDAVALVYKFHMEHDKNLAISMSVLSPEFNELLRK